MAGRRSTMQAQGSSGRSFEAGWERRGAWCRVDVHKLMAGEDMHSAKYSPLYNAAESPLCEQKRVNK